MTIRKKQNRESGVALILGLILLVLITAVAFGVIVMANTENAINTNFKSEETEYFAARAGVEEVRNRLLTNGSAFDQAGNNISLWNGGFVPTAGPDAGGKILYILGCKTQNAAGGCSAQMTLADVTTPPTAGAPNPYFDDELCHDIPTGSVLAITHTPLNVRCKDTLAAGSFTTTTSVAPYPLDYKWVRVMIKENGSGPYSVDTTKGATAPVCWDKSLTPATEVIPASGLVSDCAAAPAAMPLARPVYLVTSLAVSASGNTRRLVQEELSLGINFNTNHSWSVYGTSNACPAVTFTGNGSTGSFDSSTEAIPSEPPTNKTTTSGGDTGTNGGISLGGNATIGGLAEYAGVGSCYSVGPNAGPKNKCGNPAVPPCYETSTTQTFPVTPAPNPAPPTSSKNYSSSTTLTPGNLYGNISASGQAVITFQVPAGQGTASNPAVFVLNSLSFSGQASMVISPPNSYIQIIVAGNGAATPLSLTGQSINNTSGIPGTLVFDVAQPIACKTSPCGTVQVAGGAAAYAVVNAPMDNIQISGNGDIYGSIIGYQVTDSGNGTVWHDVNSAAANTYTPDASLYTIAFRELSY